MTQRSPMNERNTSNERKGQTRKSAASAKPVSKAASSVYVADPNFKPKQGFFQRQASKAELTPKEKKAAAARKEAKREANARKDEIRRYKPKNSREYTKWRTVYFGLLIVGLAVVLAAVFTTTWAVETGNDWLNMAMLFVAFGCSFAAIVTDIKKVKPAREAAYYKEANPKKKKNKK